VRCNAIILLALVTAWVVGCSGGAVPVDHPLRIGWVLAMANAPAMIAEKKGFFAEQGLPIQLIAFSDGPLLQQALASGELDAAYVGAPPMYQWFAHGFDSRILAKVNSGQAAVITHDSMIAALGDLRGRRLAGVARGSGMDVLLRGYVLKQAAALDPDRDLTVVPMQVGNMNAALDSHAVDAAFSWETFVSQAVLRGSARVLYDVNQDLPGFPWYVVMAPTRTLTARPGDMVKLLRAHHLAVRFLNEHREEADGLIAEAFSLAAITRSDGVVIPVGAIVSEARKRLAWSDRLEPADLSFIQRLIGYSVNLGYIAGPLQVESIVDLSFQRQALP